MQLTSQQRTGLIQQAEYAYIDLMGQLDSLFQGADFYLQRFPPATNSEALVIKELQDTVEQLGKLPAQLADVLKRWKNGESRLLSREGVEIYVLNEIWTNVLCLMMFLLTRHIDLEPYNHGRARVAWLSLQRANNLIP